MEFFVQIIYFLFITYTDLLFWKNHLQTVTKSSIKIYVDISSNPSSPLVENCRFFGNPPSPPVRLRHTCPRVKLKGGDGFSKSLGGPP